MASSTECGFPDVAIVLLVSCVNPLVYFKMTTHWNAGVPLSTSFYPCVFVCLFVVRCTSPYSPSIGVKAGAGNPIFECIPIPLRRPVPNPDVFNRHGPSHVTLFHIRTLLPLLGEQSRDLHTLREAAAAQPYMGEVGVLNWPRPPLSGKKYVETPPWKFEAP